MKKILAVLVSLCIMNSALLAQENSNIRPAAFGVSFLVNDYKTAQLIRTTSFSQVIRDKKWTKMKDAAPGIAVTYFKGLQKYIDFAGTLGGSFVTMTLPGKAPFTSDAFLMEADASVHLKMFSDDFWVSPYLNIGVGGSKYRSYYGALLPLGGGFKVNIFNEASIFINTQYRVPITTETSNYHFMHSIGIAGIIGNKK
jgi:OOP family OmpA-OmpF porin